MARRDYSRGTRRFLIVALTLILILTGAAIWPAVVLIGPPPPRSIAMATDPEGSVSAELGDSLPGNTRHQRHRGSTGSLGGSSGECGPATRR